METLVVSCICGKIRGRGGPSRSFWKSDFPDPVGEIFYVKKVVIALNVFVWQAYCWFIFCAIGKSF